MQPYGSPNPIQSRALVYCVAPQADCLSYVHHQHHGRNRLNNPRVRHLYSGSGQTAQTPISDSGSGQAGPVSCHCLKFQVLTCGRRWNPSRQQARSRLGSRSCQAGWQGRRARSTSICCPAGGASGARHLHRGAVEEKTKQRHILKKRQCN